MTLPAPTYDLVLLLDAQADEQTRAKILADTRAAIATAGEVVRDDDWGDRALAYPIGRKKDAEYHLLQFHARTPTLLHELDRTLRITDGVMRFRLVKLAPGTPDAPDMRSAAHARGHQPPAPTGGAGGATSSAPAPFATDSGAPVASPATAATHSTPSTNPPFIAATDPSSTPSTDPSPTATDPSPTATLSPATSPTAVATSATSPFTPAPTASPSSPAASGVPARAVGQATPQAADKAPAAG